MDETVTYSVDVASTFQELFYGTWKYDDNNYYTISETEVICYSSGAHLYTLSSITSPWTPETNTGTTAAQYPEGFTLSGAYSAYPSNLSQVGNPGSLSLYLKTDRSVLTDSTINDNHYVKQ
jgi:hypothetical protein